MLLTVLPYTLAICRLTPDAQLPDWATSSRFLSMTRTEDELSVVCEQALVPPVVGFEPGWRGLQVSGPLDFSLTGVLAALLAPLAQAGISIFSISTYDTDYIFVKQANLDKAIQAWREAGHWVVIG